MLLVLAVFSILLSSFEGFNEGDEVSLLLVISSAEASKSNGIYGQHREIFRALWTQMTALSLNECKPGSPALLMKRDLQCNRRRCRRWFQPGTLQKRSIPNQIGFNTLNRSSSCRLSSTGAGPRHEAGETCALVTPSECKIV